MAIDGILPVIPTPFRDGAFDGASFERLLAHMLPSVDGYTLLGSTGEAASLTTKERQQIAEQAFALTPSDKRVVVGVSSTSARESIDLACHAQEQGAAAVLCAAPYYYNNTASGIVRYLGQLDEALTIDLVLYDNPVATKTQLSAQDVVKWAGQLEHLTTVKLTDHDLSKVGLWQSEGINVMAGDDVIILRYLASGVDGAMVIAPVLYPTVFRQVWGLFGDGKISEALRIAGERMLPLLHVFGIGDEISTTKALLKEIGVFASDEVLAPLMPVTDGRRRLLRDAHAACNAGEGGSVVAPVR